METRIIICWGLSGATYKTYKKKDRTTLKNFEGRRNISWGEEKKRKRKCTGKNKENSIANQSWYWKQESREQFNKYSIENQSIEQIYWKKRGFKVSRVLFIS